MRWRSRELRCSRRLQDPQPAFAPKIQRSCDRRVGTDDAQIDFCGAPSSGCEVGPSDIGIEDTVREDGTGKGTAGRDVPRTHEDAKEEFGAEGDLKVAEE